MTEEIGGKEIDHKEVLTRIKKEKVNSDDESTVMGPPPTPIRVDERTIKRENYETSKRLKRQAQLYSRPRPWVST